MNRVVQFALVGLPLCMALGSLAETPERFFEFSQGKALPTLQESTGGETLVFEGLDADAGYYRIKGRTVMHVAGDEEKPLPDLPGKLEHPGAVLAGGSLYVAGGNRLLALNLSAVDPVWTECAVLPEAAEGKLALTALQSKLYLTGAGSEGTASYSYNPVLDEWTPFHPAPINLNGYVAVACGNEHLLYFNGNQPDDRILAYYRVTDSWVYLGNLPKSVQPVGAASRGSEFILFSPESVLSGKARLQPTKYGWIDHSVVAGLLVALILIGSRFSNKDKSSGDYFRGGNKVPWWAAGLSLFASGASAISLMAMPGKAFAENWIYFSVSIFIVIIQLPLMLLVYVPLIRRLNVATANDYLERRYGLPVRMLGFVVYSLNQMLGRMAAILLLPAIALSAIFGLSIELSILIMGVVATIYVTLGGLEAVIWTDVLQATVMLLAVLSCCIFAFFMLDVSLPDAREALAGMNKMQLFDFRFDWTAPVFLIVFSNVLSTTLGLVGDQTFIQRIQCTPTEKESRKTIVMQLAVAVPMNLVLFAMGTLLFLFYKTRPEMISPALKSDGVFPLFAAQNLPPGMAGFVVAALLAATMSTVSGAINSVANLGVEDVYRRFFPKATDHKCLALGRVLTIGLGVFGTGAALLLARTSLLSVWDLALMITGMILAPITGSFVLGIFTKRANSFGIWVGTAASIAANYYAKFYMNLHALAYLTVGVFTCIVVGYLASFLAPKTNKNLDGLTVYTLSAKQS